MHTTAAANDTTEAPRYISTVERAALIRAALKAKGWSSRLVSVKAESYSMGSSINVTVKVPHIPLSVVAAIANEHEDIRRCEASGEILSGGNRFIHVKRDSEQFRAYADALAAQLPTGRAGCPVTRARVLGFDVWAEDRETLHAVTRSGGIRSELRAYGPSSMARCLLEAFIERANRAE